MSPRRPFCGRDFLATLISCVLLLCGCNLQPRSSESASFQPTRTPEGPPQIQILSPSDGDEYVVGEEILVSVDAADSIGVNRVQLFVDGQIVHTVSSESLQGDLSLQAILTYAPQVTDIGTIVLSVRAYRGAEVSIPNDVSVVVRQSLGDIIATPANPSNLPFIPDDDVCRALINVGLNFRTGPSTGFQIITVLGSGTLAPIVGRNNESTWWQLTVNDRSGWVSADFTSEYGDCSAVNAVTDT